jgi:DNA-directed RNA polymerase specialized sigma24 family protein
MSSEPTPTDPALLALLALLSADRDSQSPDSKLPTEIILSRAGLGNAEIAVVVGKSSDAVRKMVERAKSDSKKRKGRGSKK